MEKASPRQGFITRIMGGTRWARWFAITALLQATTLCVLEALVLYYHIKDSGYAPQGPSDKFEIQFKSLWVYHGLFIAAQLFQQLLVFDALYAKNIIQIIAVGAFNLLILGYSGVQFYQTVTLYQKIQEKIQETIGAGQADKTDWGEQIIITKQIEIAIIGLSFVFTVTMMFLSLKLYKEFGWSIYKKIGADLRMRDIYKNFLILVLLLKLDVFFFAGFSAQFLILVVWANQTPSWETDIIVHSLVTTVVGFVLLISASLGLRHEKKSAMITFLVGGLAPLGYATYRVVDVLQDPEKRFEKVRIFLLLFLTCGIVLNILTLYVGYRAIRNFGKGLLPHLRRKNVERSSSGSSMTGLQLDESEYGTPKRWFIE